MTISGWKIIPLIAAALNMINDFNLFPKGGAPSERCLCTKGHSFQLLEAKPEQIARFLWTEIEAVDFLFPSPILKEYIQGLFPWWFREQRRINRSYMLSVFKI